MTDAKARLKQTFQFLRELNQLRNPVTRDLSVVDVVIRIEDWEPHPCIQVRRGDGNNEDAVTPEASEIEPLIRIKRPRLTPCPPPPESLRDWIRPTWHQVGAQVEPLESRNFEDRSGQTSTVVFAAAAERVAELETWKQTRQRWVEAERPAVRAYEVFERVHALWALMQREGDRKELVIADGMLAIPEHQILHPVLSQRLNLSFEPSVPEFRFDTGTEAVVLNRALLRWVPSVEARAIADVDQELAASPVEPLGGASTKEFFRRLVQGLFPEKGDFFEARQNKLHASAICIWREPVILARPRTEGLSATLDHIIEDLEQEATVAPDGLARIVGVEALGEAPVTSTEAATTTIVGGTEPDFLFSKPANAEQYQIAARLAKSKAVLVQGPPGTGKTHTIANLLGYLLGQGKSVLVTAHTTKALRVLRQQVDTALQPLCLSVLEGDAQGQAQLSQSAQTIADRLSRSDEASLRATAASLREKRRYLLTRVSTLRAQLRDARYSEIEEVVVDGEAIAPIEVAKHIKEDAERDGWIPGPIQSGANCPLSDIEVRRLYQTNAQLAPADEAHLAVAQPQRASLVAAADFRAIAAAQSGASEIAKAHREELWDNTDSRKCSSHHLNGLH